MRQNNVLQGENDKLTRLFHQHKIESDSFKIEAEQLRLEAN